MFPTSRATPTTVTERIATPSRNSYAWPSFRLSDICSPIGAEVTSIQYRQRTSPVGYLHSHLPPERLGLVQEVEPHAEPSVNRRPRPAPGTGTSTRRGERPACWHWSAAGTERKGPAPRGSVRGQVGVCAEPPRGWGVEVGGSDTSIHACHGPVIDGRQLQSSLRPFRQKKARRRGRG